MPDFLQPAGPKVWTPGDLGVESKNLKVTGGTAYPSGIISVAGFREFLLTCRIVIVGATTAGTAKLTLEAYGDGNGSNTLVSPIDVVTGITVTSSSTTTLAFGGPKANIVQGTGTIAGSSATDILRALTWIKATLTVVTQFDSATSAVGSLWLSGV